MGMDWIARANETKMAILNRPLTEQRINAIFVTIVTQRQEITTLASYLLELFVQLKGLL